MKHRRHESSTTKPLELREFCDFAIYSASHAFNACINRRWRNSAWRTLRRRQTSRVRLSLHNGSRRRIAAVGAAIRSRRP